MIRSALQTFRGNRLAEMIADPSPFGLQDLRNRVEAVAGPCEVLAKCILSNSSEFPF